MQIGSDTRERPNVIVNKTHVAEVHTIVPKWGQPFSEEDVRSYVKKLEDQGKFSLVIEATPQGMLKELAADDELEVPPCLELYVYRHCARECANLSMQWAGIFLPFLNLSLAYILQTKFSPTSAAAKSSDTVIAVVSVYPYCPNCEYDANSKDMLVAYIESCCAYARANLPMRGGDCGRWATRLVPEGFAYVLSVVHSPEWCACQLPRRGCKCVAVILPNVLNVWMFKIGDGRSIGGMFHLITDKKFVGPSTFEGIFDQMTNKLTVYDCSMADGNDVRQSTLPSRINFAMEVLRGARINTHDSESEPILIAQYTPDGQIDRAAAERVLFVKSAAPLGYFPGGDAYIWKAPTLKDQMAVMTCRLGECMAVATRGNFLLRRVGLLANPKDVEHMGTYVCEPVVATHKADGFWRALRLAKRSERLFTYDECISDKTPRTQITRDGLYKLLDQIGADAPNMRWSAPTLSEKRAPPPRIVQKPDKDGWLPAPISTPSRANVTKPKKRTPAETQEMNSFSALSEIDDVLWCTADKKKK